MPSMKELNEQDVIKLLRKKYGKDNVHRLTGLIMRGVPDTLISVDGKAFFLEIKIGEETLSSTQKLFIELFRQSAGTIYIDDENITYEGPKIFENVLEAFK